MDDFQIAVTVAAFAVFATGVLALRKYTSGTSVMPKDGEMAPDFTLPNEQGTSVSLESYRGQWVVLYFYPKDMTTGCSIEARNFQRDLEQYKSLDAVIVGISVDSVKKHEKFCQKDNLHFTLLSDHDEMNVSRMYGVLSSFLGFKMDKRVTFLIDPEGRIAKVWGRVNPMTHSQQVLEELHKRKG